MLDENQTLHYHLPTGCALQGSSGLCCSCPESHLGDMGCKWAEDKIARHTCVLLWLTMGVGEAISPFSQRFWAEELLLCPDALSPREVRDKQAGLNISDGGVS